MAPSTNPIAQSESKGRFMERLHLDETDENHKRVYALMKADAIEARKRLTSSSEDGLSSSSFIKISQISEEAVRKEVASVYKHAVPEIRQIYDLGQDTSSPQEDNWIIRWMIWHVFRYRDIRNRRSSQAKTSAVQPDAEGLGTTAHPARQSSRQMWDPIREAWFKPVD